MATYDLVRDLPLRIDDLTFDIAVHQVSPEFTRKTTIVRLLGNGVDGWGEDVTYDADEHQPHHLPWLQLAGSWTIDSLSKHLDGLELFPQGTPAPGSTSTSTAPATTTTAAP